MAVAGVVRRSDGLVSMAPNLGWVDVPLGARLARALATAIPIAVVNDADAGVLGESRRGAAIGVDDVLYVSGEVGVGGGMIVDGRLLTGVAGFAGEIGHMTVNPDGHPCRCGSVGCWETEVGEGRLLALAGYPADAGRAGIDAVLREAEAGSETAIAALAHVGRWLGIGLGGIVNILNPRLVILGGPHAAAPSARPWTARGGAVPPRPSRVPSPRPRGPGGAGHQRTADRGRGDGVRAPAGRSRGLVRPPQPHASPGERLTWAFASVTSMASTAGSKRRLA